MTGKKGGGGERQLVTGLWIGDKLPPLAELCIRSYQENGFRFRLLTYEKVVGVPEGVETWDAAQYLPEEEVFIHFTGSLAPASDRIRYKYLAIEGGFWTDMDMVCLRPFAIPSGPFFALEQDGVANIAVMGFPPGHVVMEMLERAMADPSAYMPWDTEAECVRKSKYAADFPEVRDRRINADWGLGFESFTRALRHCGIFDFAESRDTFYPVHYSEWKWNFDGTFFVGHDRFTNSLGVHLWGELLRREPEVEKYMVRNSFVAEMMNKYCISTKMIKQPLHEDRDKAAGSRTKIVVAICSCHKYRSKRNAVRETWLAGEIQGIQSFFFVGNGPELKGESDTVMVDADDSYSHLPHKVRAAFRHALDNYDFDWLFKCDDDTYVALDRLAQLAVPDYELVGSEYLESHGWPSGGAGYFLSRRMVEQLVYDSTLPLHGNEDVIHGQAVIAYGAKIKVTGRLRMDASRYPRPENDLVTAHWCSEERIRAIHAALREDPVKVICVQHPNWKDQILLYRGNQFVRRSTFCYGTWKSLESGHIQLDWFDWPSETFIRTDAESKEAICNGADFDYFKLHLKARERVQSFRDSGSLKLLCCGAEKKSGGGWKDFDFDGIVMGGSPMAWSSEAFDALALDDLLQNYTPGEAFYLLTEIHRGLMCGGWLKVVFKDHATIARRVVESEGGRPGLEIRKRVSEGLFLDDPKSTWSKESMVWILQSIGFTIVESSSETIRQSDVINWPSSKVSRNEEGGFCHLVVRKQWDIKS